MRLFEIILVIILLLRLFGRLLYRDIRFNALAIAGLGAFAIHLAAEGYRWQMLPLYLLTLVFGLYALWRIARFRGERHHNQPASIGWTVLWIALVGLASLPPFLLPVPQTPAPTGPYPVGTLTLEFVDYNRNELYAGQTGEPRRIMVQIWYPAETTTGAQPAPWLAQAEKAAPVIARFLGFPDFFLNHLRHARSHAYENVPLATAEPAYPLLLYSHGWNGFKAQATFLMEELASHGYVVAAPDHTYGALFSIFPDGEIVLNNPQALPVRMGLSNEDFLTAANLLGRQWAGDLSFILDQLSTLQPGDPAGFLAGHLDLEQVAGFGHSTGGGATIEFCGSDPRCQAAVGMDPYMDPVSRRILVDGLPIPYMALFSQVWADNRAENDAQFTTMLAHSRGFNLYIQGTAHFDFTDLPAFSPLAPYLGLKGPLNGERTLEIIRAYNLAFFNQALKDQATGEWEYPEVIWRTGE